MPTPSTLALTPAHWPLLGAAGLCRLARNTLFLTLRTSFLQAMPPAGPLMSRLPASQLPVPSRSFSEYLPPPLGRCLLVALGSLSGNQGLYGAGPWPELTLWAGQRRGRRALEGWVGRLAGECREGLAPRRMALRGRGQRRWPEPLRGADYG